MTHIGRRCAMKRIAIVLVGVVILAGAVAGIAPSSGHADDAAAASIAGGKLPVGYRDWRLISAAPEERGPDAIRAILGNDAAIKAYREAQPPFPDGTIISRIAWS